MTPSRSSQEVLRRRADLLAYWTVAAVPVAFVLLLPALVLQDGGLHLSSAAALEVLLSGRWTDLIDPRPGLPPNLLVELLMLGLVQFLDPNAALRVVIVLTLLGFAAAGRALAVAVGAPVLAATLFLPFAVHYLLLLGFIGLSAAVPPAMASVALVLRGPGRRNPPALALALVATWLTHLVPAVVATVVVVLVVLVHHATGADPGGRGAAARLAAAVPATVRSTGLALLPVVALGWGAVAVVVHQDTSLGTYVNSRLALFLPLLLVAWLVAVTGRDPTRPAAPARPSPVGRRPVLVGAAALAAVATVGLAVVRYPAMAELGEDLDELRTLGTCVPTGSTLVQLNLSYDDDVRSIRIRPMVEWGWLPHSLWRYTDSTRADDVLATEGNGLNLVPPRVDLSGALDAGLPLDVVILHGRPSAPDGVLADPGVRALQADLEAGFRRVAVSATGVGEVWLRTGIHNPCGGRTAREAG